MNAAKGEKRLLPQEAFSEAAREKITRPKTRSLKDQILLARECHRKLLDFPALTRKEIAKQLGVTTARLNQILGLLRLAPGIQEEILHGQRLRLSRFHARAARTPRVYPVARVRPGAAKAASRPRRGG